MEGVLVLSKGLVTIGLGIAVGSWLSLWLGVGISKDSSKLRMTLCVAITIAAAFLLLKMPLLHLFALILKSPVVGFLIITAITYSVMVTITEPISWAIKRSARDFFGATQKSHARSEAELQRDWEDFKQGLKESDTTEPTIDTEPRSARRETPSPKSEMRRHEEHLYKLYKEKKAEPASDRNYSEELMDQGGAYVARTHLMTPSERQVYQVLEKAYGDRYRIFCQVRVVDLIQPNMKKHPTWTREYKSLFRQLSQWHFDYVLCEKADFKIVCAVELDDPSHDRRNRIKRDRILDRACSDSGVVIKRIKLDDSNRVVMGNKENKM